MSQSELRIDRSTHRGGSSSIEERTVSMIYIRQRVSDQGEDEPELGAKWNDISVREVTSRDPAMSHVTGAGISRNCPDEIRQSQGAIQREWAPSRK